MIPDEVVDVAARGAFSRTHPHGNWRLALSIIRDRYRDEARAAIEAAAPHVQREAQALAWDECASGYLDQLVSITLNWEEIPNPYRPTP